MRIECRAVPSRFSQRRLGAIKIKTVTRPGVLQPRDTVHQTGQFGMPENSLEIIVGIDSNPCRPVKCRLRLSDVVDREQLSWFDRPVELFESLQFDHVAEQPRIDLFP